MFVLPLSLRSSQNKGALKARFFPARNGLPAFAILAGGCLQSPKQAKHLARRPASSPTLDREGFIALGAIAAFAALFSLTGSLLPDVAVASKPLARLPDQFLRDGDCNRTRQSGDR